MLRDQNLDVVFSVIDVRDHRDNGGYRAMFGGGRRYKNRQVAVTGEVARSTDAVHHAAAHNMGRIDVAVDIGFDQTIHGDHSQASNQFRVVTDILLSQDNTLAVEIDVGIQFFHCRGAERKGGRRGGCQCAGFQHRQHAVLNHFGKCAQLLEGASVEAFQYGVGDIADPGLYGPDNGGSVRRYGRWAG